MSEHLVAPDPRTSILERFDALTAALRTPSGVRTDPSGETYIFSPDLSAAEATTFATTIADLSAATRTRDLSLSLADYRAIKSDLATAKAYVGLASPTAAQTAAALKSLTRIVGALLRQ